jgi:trimeric autotransporter adhesin
VIIVLRFPSDCYNKTLVVANYWSVLPVQLISFHGSVNPGNKIALQWKVSNNKTADQFEVQRSGDGKDYTTVALVFSSEKSDIENYMFYETLTSFEKVIYRLKMIDKNGQVNYSRALVFQSKLTTGNTIRILGNPVTDQLTFSYTTPSARMIDIKIYDMSGRNVMTTRRNSLEGNNMISFPLDSTLKPGMHIVEVNDGTDTQKTKFVKQ